MFYIENEKREEKLDARVTESTVIGMDIGDAIRSLVAGLA